MNQTRFVNEKQATELTVTRTEYFGIQVKLSKDGILGYEGEVSEKLLSKMIDKLELHEPRLSPNGLILL